MVLKRIQIPSAPRDDVDTHVLVKGVNQYTFRAVPDDRKKVDIEVILPETNIYIRAIVPVPEGRDVYKYLLTRGYQPW